MEILLVILLLAVATFVVAVWAFFFILSRVVRAIFGIARLPGRAASAAMRRRDSDGVFDAVTQVGVRRCANGRCGASMPVEARFCGRCGSAVTANAMFLEMSPQAGRRQARWEARAARCRGREARQLARQMRHAGWSAYAATNTSPAQPGISRVA